MKRRFVYAAVGVVLQLLYLATAARCFYLHMSVWGAVIGLVGFFACGAYALQNYTAAILLGLDEEVQEIEEDRGKIRSTAEKAQYLLEAAEKEYSKSKLCSEQARLVCKELGDVLSEKERTSVMEALALAEHGGAARTIVLHPEIVCASCGGTTWLEIGGRMECVRCGLSRGDSGAS